MTRKNSKPEKAAQPPAPTDAKAAEKLGIARAILQGPSLAANAVNSLKMTDDITDVASLADALKEQCHRAIDGDLGRAESLLICQAQTLDVLFNGELIKAMRQDALLQFEAHMRIALRAQSQCRATLETLAAIKNPPVLIARQANIAHGPQQVNNGPLPAGEPPRARESQNEPNRLLEQQHGDRLDTLTANAASGTDPAMATLGEVHGAEVRRRQSPLRAQCLEGWRAARAARAVASAAGATALAYGYPAQSAGLRAHPLRRISPCDLLLVSRRDRVALVAWAPRPFDEEASLG